MRRVCPPAIPRKVYGLRVSADLISRVTMLLEEVSDWQNRALEPVYPIFLDALRVKIRDADLRTRPFMWLWASKREVLGLWIADNEGAILAVMNNLDP